MLWGGRDVYRRGAKIGEVSPHGTNKAEQSCNEYHKINENHQSNG